MGTLRAGFLWSRRRGAQGAPSGESRSDVAGTQPGSDFAWRVHDALSDWTARVDAKASIALAIEAAVASGIVLLATGDGELAHADGWTARLVLAASLLLTLSVIASVVVIFPVLRSRETREECKTNIIYFGHLRHWVADDLRTRLESDPVGMSALAHQLVTMAKIAWFKHRMLQGSLVLFVAGVLCIAGALATHRDQTGSAHDAPGASVSATATARP